jgi:hypothetical protein
MIEWAFEGPDGFKNLPMKMFNILKHYEQEDYIFKCDTDTYVALDRLLAYPYKEHDYAGYEWKCFPHPYASGGAGYWLSNEAIKVLLQHPPSADLSMPAEDYWVGQVLGEAGIRLYPDSNYAIYAPCLPSNQVITQHLTGHEPYRRELMHQAHRSYMNGSR